jgi:hypothetical protein
VATPAAWAHLGLVPPKGAPFFTAEVADPAVAPALFDPES